MRSCGALLAAAAACAAAACPALAGPLDLPPTLGPSGCFDPSKPLEPYGPTDVNVQAGNGRVTVNENSAGTITVFRYPNPSVYNLVKYLTLSRDANGRVHVQYPNEGSFAGIRYSTAAGTHFDWLREWRSDQRYDSPDTPVPVTTYRSPRRLGLRVTNIDLVPPGGDRLVREFWVSRSRRSPVLSASLVYFANFNPIATHIPFLPITDWCTTDLSDQHAAYDGDAHAIVNWWSGIDAATGRPSSIAVAFGFAGRDAAHQVGGDAYDPSPDSQGPPDAYDQATLPPHRLGGDGAADGQTTGALEQRLRFDRHGRAEARMTIAAGNDGPAALAALNAGRELGLRRQLAAVRRDWRRFLRHTRLPAGGGQRVTDVAKRSLITVRLARAAETGAIVASVNTQSPYGEDWIRDGAFINRLLDINGLAGWVTQHNLFYARVQTSSSNPSLVRPPGNWAMTYYFDGVDGGPIPWEIDETGLGIWTLFDHYRFLRGEAARRYLARVYPAIGRAADFLVFCEDPRNGLQCTANEDDNPAPTQTLHGAGPVFLGLRSAIHAAAAMGDRSPRVTAWQRRLERLRAAIEALYDPSKQAYSSASPAASAPYHGDYGDGGWLLWPVRFKPYGEKTMVGEANAVYAAMRRSLAAPRGAYEAKGLLALGYAWKPFSPARRRALGRTLRYMAHRLTTPTGLLGEAWTRVASGRPIAVQDQPHVWAHALFYLSAVQIEGSRPFRFRRGSFYARACARGAAPRSACLR
jgi:GH15 family glucan-1,4-alpha-glucosidase